MAIDSVPWFVGNGAQHSPETARALAFHATEGSNGITDGADFKVTQTPTASNNVRLAAGGGSMVSRYAGANQQSYTCRAGSVTDIEVPATSSAGGATRYVIIRVQDPQYEGQAPANVAAGPYVYPAIVSSVTNLPYPFIELARINQPASTAVITSAMITDTRKMARIKSTREIEVAYSTQADLVQTSYVQWPNFAPSIYVPDWANTVKGFARVHQPLIMASMCFGDLKIEIGTSPGPVLQSGLSPYDFNQGGVPSNGLRAGTLSCVIQDRIPEAMKGTTQRFRLIGKKNALPAENGYLRADIRTQVEFDMFFERRPI